MMSKPLLARNPEFDTVVRESFSRQAMMTTLGASLTLVEPGRVHIAFPRADRFTQQNGFVHAGAIASVADSACGYAAFTLALADTDVLAVEFKINFLTPARATAFEARARVVRSGKTLSTCFAEVFGVQNGDEELVATMMSTIITRSKSGTGTT